ncbi:MAG TPA: hypothetical protein VF571_16525 [Pyrinomonadaceae bacterium]|jgi:replicative DNA helicase
MSEPTINFGPNAKQGVVSQHTISILKEILNHAGLSSCLITSTSRTPAEQARAMYNNIVATGADKQRELYAAAGDMVIDEYEKAKKAKKSEAQIKAAMEAKIIAIGPTKVSHHCADPTKMNVVDIAPSSISNKHAFENAVQTALNRKDIIRFFAPRNGDPAYHLEIPQI